MSLLTDKELFAALDADVESIAKGKEHPEEWEVIKTMADTIEAAIFAKLASAELPEPLMLMLPNHAETGVYSADQLRQAYAQGAASQLSEKPSGYLSQHNLEMLQQGYPQTIVMLEGAKRDVPLYTRREAK